MLSLPPHPGAAIATDYVRELARLSAAQKEDLKKDPLFQEADRNLRAAVQELSQVRQALFEQDAKWVAAREAALQARRAQAQANQDLGLAAPRPRRREPAFALGRSRSCRGPCNHRGGQGGFAQPRSDRGSPVGEATAPGCDRPRVLPATAGVLRKPASDLLPVCGTGAPPTSLPRAAIPIVAPWPRPPGPGPCVWRPCVRWPGRRTPQYNRGPIRSPWNNRQSRCPISPVDRKPGPAHNTTRDPAERVVQIRCNLPGPWRDRPAPSKSCCDTRMTHCRRGPNGRPHSNQPASVPDPPSRKKPGRGCAGHLTFLGSRVSTAV